MEDARNLAGSKQRRVLIVEDEAGVRRGMARAVTSTGAAYKEAATLQAGLAALRDGPWDVVLLDVTLPDGSGVEIARACLELRPRPAVIAISGCKESVVLELGHVGVSVFLRKPFVSAELRRALLEAVPLHRSFEPAVRDAIGTRDLPSLQDELRRAAVDEALVQCDGNRTAAAELLGIPRQTLNGWLRPDDDEPPTSKRARRG